MSAASTYNTTDFHVTSLDDAWYDSFTYKICVHERKHTHTYSHCV